jgi:hypothetical protein
MLNAEDGDEHLFATVHCTPELHKNFSNYSFILWEEDSKTFSEEFFNILGTA